MANFADSPVYSFNFSKALNWVSYGHNCQIRKQGNIPYISHLLTVASLVFEAGGSENEAIAALLHDSIENLGKGSQEIKDLFGFEVACMVESLSEDKEIPKERRKQAYIDQVKHSDPGTILISAADKLHNLRSYATTGRDLWDNEKLEFYNSLIPIYKDCLKVPRHWIDEFENLLDSLKLNPEYVKISKAEYDSLLVMEDRYIRSGM